MNSSEELAQKCYRLAGDEIVSAVTKLTQLIDQDRAEQREACGNEVFALVDKSDSAGLLLATNLRDACLNAGAEE